MKRETLKYLAGNLILLVPTFFSGGYLVGRSYDKLFESQRCVSVNEFLINARVLRECRPCARAVVEERLDMLEEAALTQGRIILSEQGVNQQTIPPLQNLYKYCDDYTQVKCQEELSKSLTLNMARNWK